MIDLVLEGRAPPAAEQVTERAGVSQASLFRYFATLDELRREAITRFFERFDDLITIPDIGRGDLRDRIERLVDARDDFFAHTAPMARLARRQAADVEELATTLGDVRSMFTEQVARHFAAELEGLPPARRDQRVAVIAALNSFESWDQLAPLGSGSRRAALRDALGRLLGPDGGNVAR
jgi:AcrR family transcriptional regulator